ncbi:MAG: DUF6599 family protein [Acidobacteriaceae bacterium]
MVFSLRSVGRYAGLAACSLLFAAPCVFAQAATPAAKNSNVPKPLLPAGFSGWAEQGAPTTGVAPAAVDASNAQVLTEFGLKDFAESEYRHGSSLAHLRVMRFADATGAYGAFTFYRKSDMKPETIGNGAAANAHEAVFWIGATLVDATFDPSAAPSEASLKAMATKLPPAAGSSGVPPTLPGYLPAKSLDPSTVRYAIGPAAYAQGGGVLPASAIDFGQDAEVVTAQYSSANGGGTLTLIEYPTPQMSIHAEQAMSALLKGPLPPSLRPGSPSALGVRRSGPIVAVTSGNFSSAESRALLAQVNYQAVVTWNKIRTTKGEVKRAAEMLQGIGYLTALLIACSLLLASFLGGGRALWRILRGKPASSVYEEDFISLNLSGWNPGSPRKLP